MNSEADALKKHMIELYDRMVEKGWLKGYAWKGDTALLEFTPDGMRATEMLNRIFPKESSLRDGRIEGFLGYIESIVRNYNDPRVAGWTGGLDAADLAPFCAEEDKLWTMQRPWTRDGCTYATNSVIVVRVPARPTVPDNPDAPSGEAKRMIERFFPASAVFEPMPDLPDRPQSDARPFVLLGHRAFKLDMLRKIGKLPAVEIAPDYGSAEEPMPFRFAGDGIGLVAPVRLDDDSEDEVMQLQRQAPPSR